MLLLLSELFRLFSVYRLLAWYENIICLILSHRIKLYLHIGGFVSTTPGFSDSSSQNIEMERSDQLLNYQHLLVWPRPHQQNITEVFCHSIIDYLRGISSLSSLSQRYCSPQSDNSVTHAVSWQTISYLYLGLLILSDREIVIHSEIAYGVFNKKYFVELCAVYFSLTSP